MKKVLFLIATLLCMTAVNANAKKVLDHSSFDDWKSVAIGEVAKDGSWAVYAVNPQEGDGVLTFRNVKTGREITIPRGYRPQFSDNSRWAVALIKPFYQDTRKAKIDKKKDFDMPQDSLAIVDLKSGNVIKIARVSSYKLGVKGGEWLAYLSSDTTLIKPKALKDKKSGQPLVVRNLADGSQKVIDWVKEYTLSKNGVRLAATIKPHSSDSVATDAVVMMLLPDTTVIKVDEKKCFYTLPVFNEDASKMAFTLSNDSAESGTKRAQLMLTTINGNQVDTEEISVVKTKRLGAIPNLRQPKIDDESKRDSINAAMRERIAKLAGDSLFINQYSKPRFSENGRRLIIGVAPEVAPDDTTIVDFERAELDIWRWDAPFTPPQEIRMLDKMRKATLPVVIDLESKRGTLMSANELEDIVAGDRWNADWALVLDPTERIVQQQWDYLAPINVYAMNVNSGERRHVGVLPKESAEISPCGKFIVWYEDRNYFAYEIATGKTVCMTVNFPHPVWDEDQDVPMQRMPYGTMGWMEDDRALLIYDRHDIWQLDPTGQTQAVCITAGEGRKTNRRFTYINTDSEKRFINAGDEVLLRVFDYTTKENGYATLKMGKAAAPQIKVIDKYQFTRLQKAKNAPVYVYQKANFSTSPDVWVAPKGDFQKATKVTDANPQMKEYNWGTAELVKWYAYNGRLTEGVLYLPEDLDPTKKYPMLVVFYERNSEELYAHYTMEPSWSWVNYPFYVSRGYVVFVPDVHYAPGIPGESAYNYICSGVEELCDRFEFIDRDRIGIDGQSWGGYQTSYLVTRTDMFACAGSGAPVSNMTSAFGGIRWGTGDSRQGQYELGQSRIGRTLWEAPQLYIANSPLFYADRVNTPLLIMHNDDDGAVPWYQGIEYFMALRRLEKPVWMLQYNGEAHNIRARKNRKDITIRLQQFFDHYLKGEPMPEWMKNGIPMTRKGQEMGTGYAE